MSVSVYENETETWQNFDDKIKDLQPQEQEAVKKFWRSLVLRSQRAFSESNGNLPQYANVRSCNCCPYGYHIDLDFVRYCESLANAKPSEEELQRRCRRRSRKSMEFMLGLDSIFDQWDSSDRQQTLTELPQENELDSPYHSLQRTPSFTSTPYQYQPLRQRSSSVPRFTYGSQNSNYPRSESPFGTASSTCSSYRGAESDVPYPMRKPAVSPPETKAFLHDALDEVCSDFERTLERASMKRKKAGQRDDAGGGGDMGGRIIKPGLNNYYSMDRNNNYPKAMSYSYQERSRNGGWNWDSATYNTRETLRKYPIVPLITRVALNDYLVSGSSKYVIKKGMPVFIPIYAVHHDPEFYPEPHKFKPERFALKLEDSKGSQPWLPFGEGPRNCIGLRFGLMQTRVALAYLFLHFKFTVCEKTEIPLVMDKSSVLLSAKNGIYLQVEKII